MSKAYELGRQAFLVEERIHNITQTIEDMTAEFVDEETGEVTDDGYERILEEMCYKLSAEYEEEELINEIGKECINLEQLAQNLKEREKAFADRRHQAEKDIERLEDLLRRLTNEQKWECNDCVVSFRTSSQTITDTGFLSYCVDHPEEMNGLFTSKTTYAPDKAAIKKAIASGREIPYCKMESYKSISVK